MLTLKRYGRFWAVYENSALLCVTVYKKGANAVIERLAPRKEEPQPRQDASPNPEPESA